jgi:hypothetical protein
MNIKIASLAWDLPSEKVDYIPYKSENSLFDYDVIIFDSSRIFNEYKGGYKSDYKGHISLGSDNSVLILEDLKRRNDEINDLVNNGKTLIIFSPIPDKCWIDTGERKYDEYGGRVIIVQELFLKDFLPKFLQVDYVKSKGKNVEFKGDEIFRNFYDKIKNIICYRSYFKESIGSPFLFINGTNKIVGTRLKLEKGNVICMPHFRDFDDFKDRIDYINASEEFVSAVIDLINNLSNITGEYKLPDWTDKYFIPGERNILEIINEKETEIRKIWESINKKKRNLENIRQNKLLLSGSKIALQKQVIKVLNEIGINAKDGPEKRYDIILDYKDKIGVAEVKGKSKSAAEKDAAQLEKWVSEYFSKKGKKPKGFLIVNVFCNSPLDKRDKPAFPNQMLEYCKNREHCLITTSQLLNILIDVKANSEKRDKIINALFNTIGVYDHHNNYTEFLETSPPVKSLN